MTIYEKIVAFDEEMMVEFLLRFDGLSEERK